MAGEPIDSRRVATALGLWTVLYLGVSITLYAVFVATAASPGVAASLLQLAFALGVVVTGLAFVAVVVDRLLYTREPEDFLLRQSVWVLVLVGLTVAATGAFLYTVTGSPGDAVLLGVAAAAPTTMVLFAAVNLARYRTMEHRIEGRDPR